MNAITKIDARDIDSSSFVGSYLHHCARVEEWSAAILKEASITKKMPHLFGQKLKAVADLAEKQPEKFTRAKRVTELMQKFALHAKLRSNLAHAIQTTAANETTNYLLVRNSGTGERQWFTHDEMKSQLSDLKKLVKEILDQKLRT